MHTAAIPMSVSLLSAVFLGLAAACVWLLWPRGSATNLYSNDQSAEDSIRGARTIDFKRQDGSMAMSIENLSSSWMRPGT